MILLSSFIELPICFTLSSSSLTEEAILTNISSTSLVAFSISDRIFKELFAESLPISILATVVSIIFVILTAASLTFCAKDLISEATTANPLP